MSSEAFGYLLVIVLLIWGYAVRWLRNDEARERAQREQTTRRLFAACQPEDRRPWWDKPAA